MSCQICNGPLMLLGQLGTRVHFRCCSCGMDANMELDGELEIEEPETCEDCGETHRGTYANAEPLLIDPETHLCEDCAEARELGDGE